MKPAALIEVAPSCFALRLLSGGEAAGAYRTKRSALDAAVRRGWAVVSVEKRDPVSKYRRALEGK